METDIEMGQKFRPAMQIFLHPLGGRSLRSSRWFLRWMLLDHERHGNALLSLPQSLQVTVKHIHAYLREEQGVRYRWDYVKLGI